ncbi:MAG: RNA-binding protein [Rhizobiales bacterium 63-22]|nr:MAG: RNA-binding protein [Rhizobiales bacterium 63-22]
MKRIERLAARGVDDIGLAPLRPRRSMLSRAFHASFSICLLLVLLGGAGFVILRGGVDSELLRSQAQQSLAKVLGKGASASIGSAALSLDQDSHVAIDAHDVSIADPQQGLEIKGIRSVRLGLAPLSLLAGKLRVAQLEMEGVSFDMPENGGEGFWKSLPHDGRGFVDFDAVSNELFAAMRRSLALLREQDTQAIGIFDSTIRFKTGDATRSLGIEKLMLAENQGRIAITGAVDWQGRTITIDGNIDRDGPDNSLHGFTLNIDGIAVAFGSSPKVAPVVAGDRVNPAHFSVEGTARLSLSGTAATAASREHVAADLALDGIDMDLGDAEGLKGKVLLHLEHTVGSGKIEVKDSRLELGGLQAAFNGAFGPEPGQPNPADGPAYRFELLTSSATSMPAESSDPPLSFATRIAGRFLASQQRIQFANLDVSTETGRLYGQGNMAFGNGSPEMIFMLRIPQMAVADAKHLWPVDVADGARLWVLKNLFGGTLKNSRIDVSLPGGRFNGPGLPPPLTADEVKADFNVEQTRFDVVGDLPPVREANGQISVRGSHTTVKLLNGVAYTPNNRKVDVSDGTLVIPWGPQRPVIADLDLGVTGDAAAIAEIAGNKPIDVLKDVPFQPQDVTGSVQSRVKVNFAISKNPPPGTLKWSADIGFSNLNIDKPVGGSAVTDAKGNIAVDQTAAVITADAKLDGIPGKISMTEPVDLSGPAKRNQKIRLEIDDKTREAVFPGINSVLTGPVSVDLALMGNGERHVSADFSRAQIDLPWLGWRKGVGVPAKATFDLTQGGADKSRIGISNLVFSGDTFGAKGDISIAKGDLQSAKFSEIYLNRDDNLSLSAVKSGGSYRVKVQGTQFDARALVKQLSDLGTNKKSGGGQKSGSGKAPRIVVSAQVSDVGGFNGESLHNVAVSYESAGGGVSGVSVNATTTSGRPFAAVSNEQSNARSISLQSTDAGAVLRFFDFYDKMQGGRIAVSLAAQGNGPLRGQIDARDFAIVNEPRLAKIVSSSPPSGGASLNQAVKRNIDVSRVDIERGFSLIEKGKGYLKLSNGVVRGPLVGTTFQGTLYDPQGNMSITGTFMPAYGINRIFGEVPIFGALLGNGRDRGLIGITYKLTGSAKQPQVMVNPISIIAPGIFRSIFEF